VLAGKLIGRIRWGDEKSAPGDLTAEGERTPSAMALCGAFIIPSRGVRVITKPASRSSLAHFSRACTFYRSALIHFEEFYGARSSSCLGCSGRVPKGSGTTHPRPGTGWDTYGDPSPLRPRARLRSFRMSSRGETRSNLQRSSIAQITASTRNIASQLRPSIHPAPASSSFRERLHGYIGNTKNWEF
jgi:hypothetical protein